MPYIPSEPGAAPAADRRRRTVALLMPARNEERSVVPTLEAVFASSRLPDEIVVADGGSTDETVSLIGRYRDCGVPIRIVDNPEIYAGAGRNHAAAASTSEILLFLDFGNIIEPDWIGEMVAPLEEDPSLDGVGGMFVPDETSDYEHCVAAIQYLEPLLAGRLSLAEKRARMPAEHRLGGLGAAVTRSCWVRCSGQPAWLRAGEDQLFGRKLNAMNARLTGAPAAVLRHHMRDNPRALYHQNFVYARGDGRTAHSQPHYRRLFWLYAAVVASMIVSPWSLVAPAAGLGLLAMHLVTQGYRRLLVADGGIRSWRLLLLVPAVVFPKDAGTMAGYVAGCWDWLVRPEYRRRYREYMSAAREG
ncbi:MAG: glycosyltransferase [Betaproteobacteria bacterium]|nr:glycosyltransferase [Betaproteobacteria bacterium]